MSPIDLGPALDAVSAALAAALWLPSPARRGRPSRAAAGGDDDTGRLHRWRWAWALLAGLGAAAFVSGSLAGPAGGAAGVLTWVWIGRTEPVAARRRRQEVSRDLPGLVHLLAAALSSGCDIADGLRWVCLALPGPAAELVATVSARLAMGVAPDVAWRPLTEVPELAPLARAMVRAHRSGTSVAQEVSRVAHELEDHARAAVEERARAVGVKAALPLGLCLLPAFLLLGVVPMAAALLSSLAW